MSLPPETFDYLQSERQPNRRDAASARRGEGVRQHTGPAAACWA